MVLVFDMGATRGRFALVSRGKLGDVVHVSTDPAPGGFNKLQKELENMAVGHRLEAVVGGMPGQLTGEEGRFELAHNLPNWVGVPVAGRLKQTFRCPIYITNDVVLGGVGESHYGAGIKKGVMAYFTVSTGVNAVRLVDGAPDKTIGRFDVGSQLVTGVDGRLETLESMTGGAAFELRRGLPPREVRDPAVWEVEARNLAVGVYNTALHWAPEVIVFGGSMMRDIDLGVVRSRLEELPAVLKPMPRLEYGKLGDEAGLHGAMASSERVS